MTTDASFLFNGPAIAVDLPNIPDAFDVGLSIYANDEFSEIAPGAKQAFGTHFTT